eukprot:4317245-Amphidinium_carterae.1
MSLEIRTELTETQYTQAKRTRKLEDCSTYPSYAKLVEASLASGEVARLLFQTLKSEHRLMFAVCSNSVQVTRILISAGTDLHVILPTVPNSNCDHRGPNEPWI